MGAPSSADLELLGFVNRWCGVEQLGATFLLECSLSFKTGNTFQAKLAA